MSIVRWIKSDLFKEPTGGRRPWLTTAFGLLMIGLVIGGTVVSGSWLEPKFVFLGFAFVALGTAETLPADRVRLAGILRISAICMFFSFGGITIASTLRNSEGQAQLMMAFYFVVSILVVITLYVAWEFWKAGRDQ
ncbi:hypothetical protein [Halopenitus sp. POP-27]|uniref:hypothetical protein n=1 Tax=Halopenitus sp. POP-27 TaxID=2994425 RepID=UPI00246825E3|nr:hypothetical protein [Halopenitus sp. POP-27]